MSEIDQSCADLGIFVSGWGGGVAKNFPDKLIFDL